MVNIIGWFMILRGLTYEREVLLTRSDLTQRVPHWAADQKKPSSQDDWNTHSLLDFLTDLGFGQRTVIPPKALSHLPFARTRGS